MRSTLLAGSFGLGRQSWALTIDGLTLVSWPPLCISNESSVLMEYYLAAAVDAGVIPRDLNSIANSGACNGF